jgi:hypothetical protein|tara:strand:- start:481 stop:1002 length:522 start_codon:yes stop_codon:yes gene_type:complete
MAQEAKPKVKEVGITFYNLKNYGAIFKIGQEDRLWRFRVLSSSANKTDYGNQHLTNFNLNLSAGRERRKSVSDKLNFIYGIELSGGIQSYKRKVDNLDITTTQNSFTVGFTGVLGFNYFITKSLFVGGELLPIAQFRQVTEKDSRFTDDLRVYHVYNFGFNNNSVLLSVGFKF